MVRLCYILHQYSSVFITHFKVRDIESRKVSSYSYTCYECLILMSSPTCKVEFHWMPLMYIHGII